MWRQLFCLLVLLMGWSTAGTPNLESHLEKFRAECVKNGGKEAFEQLKSAQKYVETCAKSIVDWKTLEAEIENAKPRGDLDEVFKKYCDKSAQIKGCFGNLTSIVEGCLNSSQRVYAVSLKKATDQLVDFACNRNGDILAIFFGEQGPECFRYKSQGIRDCVETRIKNFNVSQLFEAGNEETNCNKLKELRICAVSQLEECSTPIPGNLLDSLFNYLWKGSPCKNYH